MPSTAPASTPLPTATAGFAWHPDEEAPSASEAEVCAAIQAFCVTELTAADAGIVTGPTGMVYHIEIVARLIPVAAAEDDPTAA